MNKLISVVVLNYNGKEYLKNCFDSLQKQTYSPVELIVVDNNSTDGSVDFVKTKFPQVKIIKNEKNFGFAQGNNIGVLNASSRYVAILNNDTVVNEEWLQKLWDCMKATDSVIVGSKIYTVGVPDKYYEKNGTLNLIGYNIYNIFNDPQEIFIASGCSLLFDKEKIAVPFDPDYFFYSEDVYLSWFARLKGYKISQCSESIVQHLGSVSTRKQKSSVRTFYQERNRILNLFIFYDSITLLKIIPCLIFDIVFKPLYIIFNPNKSFTGWIKAILWFFLNLKIVCGKRKKIQNQRIISNTEILKYMSSKIFNSNKIICKIVNTISCLYCYFLKLKTVEFRNTEGRSNNYKISVPTLKYHHSIEKSHFERETTHGQIIGLIDKNSVVLDVGCSTGFLGRYLIENKNCKMYGIEIDEESAKIAQSFYHKIVILDVEKSDVFEQLNEKFDFIVFGDVLEHLKDPEHILIKAREKLNPNGSIIISIPNIANWRVRWNLLFGKFEYQESGILDKNHLRFFTLHSIKKMFDKCGYDIVHFRGAGAQMPVFVRNLYPALLASQFVFRIKLK
ncbi:MAG: bifunctional glycosyltransferase family 2 protein/class I SAM-dependent methyltransferase [Elusimicrobiota bacterium]